MASAPHHHDPFDASKDEVKGLLDQARYALRRLRACARQRSEPHHAVTVSGNDAGTEPAADRPATDDSELRKRARRAAGEFEDAVSAAADEVGLLRSVVDALKTGRVRKAAVPHHVLAEREDFVEEAEREIAQLRRQADELKASPALARHFASASPLPMGAGGPRPAGHGRYDSDDDDLLGDNEPPQSIQQEMESQRAIQMQQAAALDRLHEGLTGASQKAGLMRTAIDEDARAMEDVETDLTHLGTRLQQQTRKINEMLDKMSAKRRCALVAGLVFTAALLLLLIVTT